MNHTNSENLQKILDLTKKRIEFFHDIGYTKDRYQWSKTYFDGIIIETEEAAQENKSNNHIYLEDELGDIFWNFCCLLSSLEREGKISARDAVFHRASEKFIQRVGDDGCGGHEWEQVKAEQKINRKKEHEQFYNTHP